MAFTDSTPVDGGPLDLAGVWIHDPTDPQGTVRDFPVGRASRNTNLDVGGTQQRFAGREFPVVDFGEHTDRTVHITIQVPFSATHQTEVDWLDGFATTKATLVVRDNRGRAITGTMSRFQVNDAMWGSAVSFLMTKVDSDQTEVVV